VLMTPSDKHLRFVLCHPFMLISLSNSSLSFFLCFQFGLLIFVFCVDGKRSTALVCFLLTTSFSGLFFCCYFLCFSIQTLSFVLFRLKWCSLVLVGIVFRNIVNCGDNNMVSISLVDYCDLFIVSNICVNVNLIINCFVRFVMFKVPNDNWFQNICSYYLACTF
jgi:hypothetical protein